MCVLDVMRGFELGLGFSYYPAGYVENPITPGQLNELAAKS